MFGIDFYPTPPELIKRLVEPYLFKYKDTEVFPLSKYQILEPSAGAGNILEYIKQKAGFSDYNGAEYFGKVTCLEIDPDLQSVLRGKGYNIAGADFLSWKPHKEFDLILMNPPFSNGIDHILHAWSIINEGEVACILNAETLKNPYSEKRQLLQRIIKDNNGKVEIIENAFTDAERKTDVEIAIVRLVKKQRANKFDFNFENAKDERKFAFNMNTDSHEVANRDVIGNLVAEFDRSRGVFTEAMRAISKLRGCTSRLGYTDHNIKEIISYFLLHGDPLKTYNLFSDEIRRSAWDRVFKETKAREYMSDKMLQKFERFQKEQGEMSFSKENIIKMLETLMLNQGDIYQAVVEEMFDLFTKYYDENRVHVEGWKTNDAFKVNRRVILPWIVEKSFSNTFSVKYNSRVKVDDIDRALCFIAGKKLADIKTVVEAVKECKRSGETVCSEFFEIKCYLKGTIHLKFLEEWHWRQFNLVATKSKNWIPYDIYEKEKREINKMQITM